MKLKGRKSTVWKNGLRREDQFYRKTAEICGFLKESARFSGGMERFSGSLARRYGGEVVPKNKKFPII